MKFKPTLVAVAVSTLALSVQAQVFANRELETQTKYLTAVGATQAWARRWKAICWRCRAASASI